MKRYDELEFPEGVVEAEEAYELLRFWVVDKEDAVNLNVGLFGEGEAEVWGSIIADISRHCVRAMCQENPELDSDLVRARMENAYLNRLNEKDETSGSLIGKQ